MNKGLEALKSFKSFTKEDDYIIENKTWKKVLTDNELKEKYDIIEKELKAWQAVKEQLIRCPMVGGFDIFILNGDAIYPEDDCYELLEELIV